jgi:hypothetical protein
LTEKPVGGVFTKIFERNCGKICSLRAQEGVWGGNALAYLGGSGIRTTKEPEKISARTLFWVESGLKTIFKF